MNEILRASLLVLSELEDLKIRLETNQKELSQLLSRVRVRKLSQVKSIEDVFELQAAVPLENNIARIELRIAEIKLELAGQSYPGKELRKLRQGKKVTEDRRELYLAIDAALRRNDKLKGMKLTKQAVIYDLRRHDRRFRGEKAENLRKAHDKWVKGGRK